jgi:triacylglycerol lipase
MPHPFDSFQPATALYRGDNAVALSRAARLAYNPAGESDALARQWGFPRRRFIDRRESQCLVMGNPDAVVVAFRGTEPDRLKDWMTDLDIQLVSGPFGQVHNGFLLALSHVWDELNACVGEFQDQGQSLWVTGHSLGAALATLAVARWRVADKPVHGLYNFGGPRVGDRAFERTFDQDFGARNFRFVNNADLVTRVPLRTMGFSHAGTLIYFDSKGRLIADPGIWDAFLNRIHGRIEDLGRMGAAALKQHSIDQYVRLCEKNRAVSPF